MILLQENYFTIRQGHRNVDQSLEKAHTLNTFTILQKISQKTI